MNLAFSRERRAIDREWRAWAKLLVAHHLASYCQPGFRQFSQAQAAAQKMLEAAVSIYSIDVTHHPIELQQKEQRMFSDIDSPISNCAK